MLFYDLKCKLTQQANSYFSFVSEAVWKPREWATFPLLSFLCGWALLEKQQLKKKHQLLSSKGCSLASLSPSQASLLHSCTLSETHLCQSIWSHQIQGLVESCAALPLCDSTDLSESAVVQRCNRTSWWSQHANDCDHMRFLTQCLWKSEISQARAFMNSNYWEH